MYHKRYNYANYTSVQIRVMGPLSVPLNNDLKEIYEFSTNILSSLNSYDLPLNTNKTQNNADECLSEQNIKIT